MLGCVCGSDIKCYISKKYNKHDIACERHCPGTSLSGCGKILLGMPKGFNRLGLCGKTVINIFNIFPNGWEYTELNVPVWKYLDDKGNTLVRGLCPRVNSPFIHIYLENCIDKRDVMR